MLDSEAILVEKNQLLLEKGLLGKGPQKSIQEYPSRVSGSHVGDVGMTGPWFKKSIRVLHGRGPAFEHFCYGTGICMTDTLGFSTTYHHANLAEAKVAQSTYRERAAKRERVTSTRPRLHCPFPRLAWVGL